MKKLILPAFVLMICIQWLVPLKMIFDSQSVLSEGEIYKFRTEPIDPSDPFRGKYVVLRFNAERFETDTTREFYDGQDVYALLGVDSAGFVMIQDAYTEEPDPLDNTFLKVKIGYTWINHGKQLVSLRLPFDRFYVEESKASDVEQAYWNAQRDSTQVAYALIRVHQGDGIIENVMINDKPILEIVKEINENESRK